ncbi:LysR family transcriptional regulator [Marinobacterium zhoushanense]|uniref:LysR family transcriptional regulator n=1 Tax=Marinobacterium zhoushanense TaxID=1679163 RepID=A0ABQ1KGJ6_9GAMM|nr:LysR family transcriptional regulator [Marinobacterium zhoushanense]GGB96119.1 LysR family transcriptional regulator [Marinobacterium zhoushanense]
MTNEQLRAFVAVVEQGSFRGAAERVFKTQSTVSAAVRALEETFGFRLFNRERYRPTLTDEGRAFYRQARRLLGEVQELENLGHRLALGEAPVLSLTLSAMCADPLWLDAVRRFCNRYPQMRLKIDTQHLSGLPERLLREKTDLAIGPRVGLDERFELVGIGDIGMVTVAAPDFLPGSLLDCGERIIPQAELRNRPHILISDTGSLAPFDHINVLPAGQRWYVGDYQMKRALLVAGLGWARMPEHMVEAELNNGQLVALEVDNFNSRSRVPIYLIRLRDIPLSELARAFWQEMTSASLAEGYS